MVKSVCLYKYTNTYEFDFHYWFIFKTGHEIKPFLIDFPKRTSGSLTQHMMLVVYLASLKKIAYKTTIPNLKYKRMIQKSNIKTHTMKTNWQHHVWNYSSWQMDGIILWQTLHDIMTRTCQCDMNLKLLLTIKASCD